MGPSSESFTADIDPPVVVGAPDEITWDHEADIVVVGFGGAGVVASLHAREEGASVIAVDRFEGGGATAQSGGVIYAGGTRFQRDAGFDDTPEEMFKYLSHEGTPVSPETLRRFCESSSDNLDWLMRYGVRFDSTFYPDRTGYPPDGYFLYYTGMEKFRADLARPAPRGHRTVGNGPTGQFYYAPLKNAALQAGVHLLQHAPARRLILDKRGDVLGAEAQLIPAEHWNDHQDLYDKVNCKKPFNGPKAEKAIADCARFERDVPQRRIKIRARSGVILATGGYNYNLKLFSRYWPSITAAHRVAIRGGSMGCDGSGIELGVSVGGTTGRMSQVFVGKSISPPRDFVKGVAINLEGVRFINEDAYLGNFGFACSQQSHGGAAWLIVDNRIFWSAMRQLIHRESILQMWGMTTLLNVLFGGTKRARTIRKLARKCGIDRVQLEHTISQYNEMATQGKDSAFHKQSQNLVPLEKPPFRGINLSLANRFGFVTIMPYGGLTVDERTGGVTRVDGSVIGNLYAAGRTAVGVCSKSNFSGLSIADTVFSGRRAAAAAMARQRPLSSPDSVDSFGR